MPFDPSQFVYQPRPLQAFNFGAGFRQLAESRQARDRITNQDRQAREQLAEQQAGRYDLNTRFAAQEASGRADNDYQRKAALYKVGVGLTDDARKAVANGDWNTADALAGRIVELGGKVNKTTGANGRPVYTFEAPPEPAQPGADYSGTRQQIFGGPPAPPGQPFMMRGNAPGEKNPFEFLPGSSAAAAQPQPASVLTAPTMSGTATAQSSPAPAPGAQSSAEPPAASPPAAPPDAQSMQLQQPQVGPNPFDPFTLDTNQLIAQNDLRLKPYLEGVRAGVPSQYQYRLDKLNEATSGLGLPPEESLKLYQPTLNTLAGLMGDQIRAESASASASLRGQGMEFSQNQRLREFAGRKVAAIQKQFDTVEDMKRYKQVWAVKKNLAAGARGNGNADVMAISDIRDLYQSGVMTDSDFKNAREGIKTWWARIKDGTIQNLLKSGIAPDARRDLLEVAAIAEEAASRNLLRAQEKMLGRVRNDRTIAEEERQEFISATMDMVPEELWSDELREYIGEDVEQKTGPMDQSGNYGVGPGGRGGSRSATVRSSARGRKVDPNKLRESTADEAERLMGR